MQAGLVRPAPDGLVNDAGLYFFQNLSPSVLDNVKLDFAEGLSDILKPEKRLFALLQARPRALGTTIRKSDLQKAFVALKEAGELLPLDDTDSPLHLSVLQPFH